MNMPIICQRQKSPPPPTLFFPDKNPFNSDSESKDDAVKTVTGVLRGLRSHEVRQQQSPQLYVTFVVSAFSSH